MIKGMNQMLWILEYIFRVILSNTTNEHEDNASIIKYKHQEWNLRKKYFAKQSVRWHYSYLIGFGCKDNSHSIYSSSLITFKRPISYLYNMSYIFNR